MRSEVAEVSLFELPRIPASASALIFDVAGRLLIPKPNYKKGRTIPGGQIEPNRESPWEACQRETTEECGLEVARGRLVSVDFLRPKGDRPGGVAVPVRPRRLYRFAANDDQTGRRGDRRAWFAELAEATGLLSGPIRRRVAASARATRCLYLEDGRSVCGIDQ
jgi:8-oxo-dGTP diphosphatase